MVINLKERITCTDIDAYMAMSKVSSGMMVKIPNKIYSLYVSYYETRN